jgi:hypothetical protein
VRIVVLGVLAALALAGCGSSSDPSGASPARLAPANSLFYLELTVRPQGAQRDAVQSALTRVIGHSPDAEIQRAVAGAFQKAGVSYSHDISPWLGQRIGIVVTGVSSQPDVGLIAPTSDPSGALAALRRLARRAHLRSADYRGVHYQVGAANGKPLALGIVSRAAVVATPPVFTSIVDASEGHGLSTTPGFSGALQTIPQTALVRGYFNVSGLSSSLRLILGRLSSAAGAHGLQAQAVAALLHRFKGAVGFSLTAQPNAFVADVRSTTSHPSPGADVSALPAQSWLALAGGVGSQRTASLLNALRGSPAFAASLARFRSRTGLDLLRDVLPGLGRVELSIQGTSPLALGAGVLATPSDPAAGRRLLAGIHRLASRSPSLTVQGSEQNFAITKRGSLLPRILVSGSGSRIAGTFDESLSQLVAPSQRLSDNPRFSAARGRLPTGSRVSMFVDFRALAQLLQGLPSFSTNPHNARVLAVLQRFDYLVLGSDPATGQSRLVLALR